MKRFIKIMFFFIMIIIPVYLVFMVYPQKIFKVNTSDYVQSDNIISYIDSIQLNQNVFDINGWVLLLGESQKYTRYNKFIWFIDADTGQIYSARLNPSSSKRYDVTQVMNDGVDYRESGFSLQIDLEDINLNNVYKIYICYQSKGNNILSDTNYIIKNNKLEKVR